MAKDALKILGTFFEITLIFTGISLVCYLLLGQILEITGDSMYPLLKDHERILAEKISPKFSAFKRGEIVVFESVEDSEKLIIKRIVGLPGDKFAINSGNVFINDKKLEEFYLEENIVTKPGDKIKEAESIIIPDKFYLVLGDNRDESIDSRTWGFVPEENMVGRALLVYKPISNFRVIF